MQMAPGAFPRPEGFRDSGLWDIDFGLRGFGFRRVFCAGYRVCGVSVQDFLVSWL